MKSSSNRSAGQSAGVPVLIYHGFFKNESELASVPPAALRYFLSTDQFKGHLDYLVANGFQAYSLEAFLAASDAPAKSVVLCMDGGYVSGYDLALPLMKLRGFSASYFPVANWVSQPGQMNPEQLRAVVAQGMSVGSHGLNYTPVGGASEEVVQQEVVESKKKLEDMLGLKMRHLALSEGFVSRKVVALARQTGYENLCISKPGFFKEGFLVKRMGVTRMTDLPGFTALVNKNRVLIGKRYAIFMAIQGTKQVIGIKNYEKAIQKVQQLRGRK